MKVVLVDEKTGSEYIEEVAFLLPLYKIGETVGFYKDDSDKTPIEAKITRIEMSMFKMSGDQYQAYAYELSSGEVIEEENISYVL